MRESDQKGIVTPRLLPIAALMGFVALCGCGGLAARAEFSSAVRSENVEIGGINSPGEIIVDFWGIPHIYAGSERDVFFLQGFNVARERLWQIDLWRKRGLGLLAKDFGPKFVAKDRAARLFLYRGDLETEWRAYGQKAKEYFDAFADGINAYIGEVSDGRQPLPVEFRIAGTRPAPWRAEDVVRVRSHALTRNLRSEVRRSQVVCAAGIEADRLRVRIEPPWKTTLPDGLDPCVVPSEVLADYDLASEGVSFTALSEKAELEEGAEGRLAAEELIPETMGSNAWVIAGGRTTTGRPILANDPHRLYSVPSLRYMVHLNAPGLSVIGASEPPLPGIVIGHNGKVAFGLTIFDADQEDLYVYDLNPENPNEYRYGDHWEAFRIERELVDVKGEAAREIEMRFTRHGPVLATGKDGQHAFAIRTVWTEPGTSAYLGATGYVTARSWNEFLSAVKRWGAPSENLVYADTEGNIGLIAAGRVPIRKNWDGLFPVPGDGRYEWSGYLSQADLPRSFNPKRGWLATANEMNLPSDYPTSSRKIGFDQWADAARFIRISEVLESKEKGSLSDSMDLQGDDTNVHARRLIALLRRIPPADPSTEVALRLLENWDASEREESAAAAIFEVWIGKYLRKAVVDVATPSAARGLIPQADIGAVIGLLEHPDSSLGAEPEKMRDRLMIDSLASAVHEVISRLGPDPANWSWGKLHRATFVHALAAVADEPTRNQLQVGPLAVGGASNVPHAGTYNPKDFALVSGASFRMVLDVGNWDQSRAINAPGQSGNPYSAHYRDLAPLWAAGEYVPLRYSRDAVERSASECWHIAPKTK